MRLSLPKLPTLDKEPLRRCTRRFDSNELEVLQQIYKELSLRSQSNGIDKETFLQYFDLPGLWGERLFRHFDANESSNVELEEFLAGIAACCRGTRSEKIAILFHVFDLNDDGLVQKSELVTMLSNFPVMTNTMTRRPQEPPGVHTAKRAMPGGVAQPRGNYGWTGGESGVSEAHLRVPGFDDPVNIKKSIHQVEPQWEDLASSISKLSFASRMSSELQLNVEAMDSVGTASPDTPHTGGREEGGNADGGGWVSLGLAPSMICGSEKPWDVPLNEEEVETGDVSYTSSADNSVASNTPRTRNHYAEEALSSGGTSSWIPFSPEACLSEDETKIPSIRINDGDATADGGARAPSPFYGSQCVEVQPLQDSVAATIAAAAVVEKDRLTGGDGTALDVLAEQIVEDCRFTEHGSLDFDAFKAWLDRNNLVLTMFSEYLHEEVWGLQGNAFKSSPESRLLMQSTGTGTGSCTEQTSVSAETASVDASKGADLTFQNKAAQRMVYRMFLASGQQAQAFEDCTASLEKVVSEELLQYIHHVSSNAQGEADARADGRSTSCGTGGVGASPMALSFERDYLSCPSCNTPFFMCPLCFKKQYSLSLHIENEVYIRCDDCAAQDKEARFVECWICKWNFSGAMRMALLEQHRQQVQEPQREDTSSASVLATPSSPCLSLLRENRRSLIRPTVSVAQTTSLGDWAEDASAADRAFDARTRSTSSRDWPRALAKMPNLTGYMYKRGKRFYQWEKRYYVLIDNLLYYYVNENSARPRGCIFLEGCYLDSLPGSELSSMFGFSICHKGYRLNRRKLFVATKAEFFEWVEALSAAMKQQSLMQLYTVCEQLGHGKFSVVYRAIHKATGEEYAVKIVDKTKICSQERDLLRSEIAILRLLRHQHVIYLKDVSDMRDSLYIVMELVRGGELYDLINQRHRFTEAHTHRIICQLLQIVAYLHKCGIIHRDIKPENILLTDKSEAATIKLTDFGLSTLCGPKELLTQPCGTMAYVAPEVLTLEGYNQKVDVWSIGVIMYLLLRGRLPFPVKQVITVDLRQHYRVRFDSKHWDVVSPSAKDLIARMLQPDPAARITVFEALEHIWVRNFVAVNHDEAYGTVGAPETTNELIRSLRTSTDTTFVIPYSESCIRNLNALQAEDAEHFLSPVQE
ncbi:calcium dependent protein kinase CDPK7 [Babesia caballi]|uniref:Calcium dependent protein kinase CDPK7 n=1 Tax=Babesia caballi TaxID=5871 RepID=A0AAV4LYQ8_BABCB|nr:calcium dependent protein kinase CDPK7 [Babesia caballi]